MKIALVPLKYKVYNYGGVLQFFALQKMLEKLGHSFEIIKIDNSKFVCNKTTYINKKQKWKNLILKPIYKVVVPFRRRNLRKKTQARRDVFDNFININFAKTVNIDDVNIRDFDCAISGSDQIWNPAFARERCFLTFVPDDINKIIYAASLGTESLTDYQKSVYKPLVERINHISVREYSAKRIFDSFIDDKEISVTLDPTLLLSEDEWNKYIVSVEHKGYILTYFLGESADFMEQVRSFAQQRKLKIINIPSDSRIDRHSFADLKINNADPFEFISLIKNADYVFTDSFHGCVFSSIFKKQFFVYERKGHSAMMGRIDTLLENFDIKNRIVSKENFSFDSQIDYADYDDRRHSLAQNSIDFLKESIKNET